MIKAKRSSQALAAAGEGGYSFAVTEVFTHVSAINAACAGISLMLILWISIESVMC